MSFEFLCKWTRKVMIKSTEFLIIKYQDPPLKIREKIFLYKAVNRNEKPH